MGGGTSAVGDYPDANARVLNIANGNTWFFKTPTFDGRNGTNETFQLLPGTYEFDIQAPLYSTRYSTMRLEGNGGSGTSYSEVAESTTSGVYLADGVAGLISCKAILRHTNESETFRVNHDVSYAQANEGLGARTGDAAVDFVGCVMAIRKIK